MSDPRQIRNISYKNFCDINSLIGKTLTTIEKTKDEESIYELIFTCLDGKKYIMWHDQDCCESVELHEVIGDLDVLLNTPIIMAEEISNSNETKYGSETWTFIKLATINGYVTLRWWGRSNGYYSEHVNFAVLPD